MRNKGVELSLQTIIIAVLLLIVLAISVFFILKGGKLMNEGTTCQNCIPKGDACNGIIVPFECGSDKVCCEPYDKKN
ncbi:MAG: hypothetical protein KatS3mg002_0485 [Candidatus Woesearchaeota archaeon]|nr:MAG: hypothetical protein KatS3mg002_0485 [Candidatus Woesearchaeota archaeon]